MAYKVEWSHKAEKDFENIIAYLYNESEQYADGFYIKLHSAVNSLAMMPERGSQKDEILGGARCIFVDSYIILYVVDDKNVIIYSILHQSRNSQTIFK